MKSGNRAYGYMCSYGVYDAKATTFASKFEENGCGFVSIVLFSNNTQVCFWLKNIKIDSNGSSLKQYHF